MKIWFATMLLAFLLDPQLSISQTSENKGSTDGFVQVDGSRIYYQECGSGPSAVVLMHDGVVDSAVWNDVWPSFCKDFHAIRYDRRGYGRSPETKKPYYEADDLAILLRDRGVTHARSWPARTAET